MLGYIRHCQQSVNAKMGFLVTVDLGSLLG